MHWHTQQLFIYFYFFCSRYKLLNFIHAALSLVATSLLCTPLCAHAHTVVRDSSDGAEMLLIRTMECL